MKKTVIAILLVFLIGTGYAAVKSVAHESASKSGETPEASKLIGKGVKNPLGENLGAITGVVTGPQGRTAFAVLNYWISDDTQKRIAVPFGVLSCDEQNCVLHANKKTLDAAPTFVSEDDLIEPKLAEHVYRYFGLQPYWTER